MGFLCLALLSFVNPNEQKRLVMTDQELTNSYRQRLTFAYYGGTPIAHREPITNEPEEAGRAESPRPAHESIPMSWEIRIESSSLVVKLWFLDPASGLRSQAGVLPISALAQPLGKILAAVNRKAGAPVPQPIGKP